MKRLISILLAAILTISAFCIPTSARETLETSVSLDSVFKNQVGSLDYFHSLGVSYVQFRMSRDLYDTYLPIGYDEAANEYTYQIDGNIYEEHLNKIFKLSSADFENLRYWAQYDEESHTYKVEWIGGFGGTLAPREYIGFKENADGTYYVYYATYIREELPDSEYDKISELDWPNEYEYDGKIFEAGPDGYTYTAGLANSGRRYTVEYSEETGYVRFLAQEDYTEADLPESFDSKSVTGVVFVEKHYKTDVDILNAAEQFAPFTTINIEEIKQFEYGEENYSYAQAAKFLADKADDFKYYNIYGYNFDSDAAKPIDGAYISFKIPEGYDSPVVYRFNSSTDNEKLPATIDKSTNSIVICVSALGKFVICNSTQKAVSVEAAEGVIPTDAELKINSVSKEEFKEILPAIENISSAVIYDISLINDENVSVQPNGELKISILAPEGSNNGMKVYHVADNGTMTDMNAVFENGYYTFTTTHLSFYMLADPAELFVLGDVNGDSEVDKYDYIALKRAVMGTLDLTDAQQKAADVNGKDGVEKYDYILIKRHVMGTYTIGG